MSIVFPRRAERACYREITAASIHGLRGDRGQRSSSTPGFEVPPSPLAQRVERRFKKLDRVNRAELDALVRGDYAGAASYYASDAVLLPPDGSVVRGRAAIETYWRALEGSELSGVRTRVISGGGHGDLAFLAGESGMKLRKPDTAAEASRGTFLLVFRRSAGKWEIVQDSWSSQPGIPEW